MHFKWKCFLQFGVTWAIWGWLDVKCFRQLKLNVSIQVCLRLVWIVRPTVPLEMWGYLEHLYIRKYAIHCRNSLHQIKPTIMPINKFILLLKIFFFIRWITEYLKVISNPTNVSKFGCKHGFTWKWFFFSSFLMFSFFPPLKHPFTIQSPYSLSEYQPIWLCICTD